MTAREPTGEAAGDAASITGYATTRTSVLVITAHYPPSNESGARRPWELVSRMQDAGVDVTVLTADVGGAQSNVHARGEVVQRLPPPGAYLAEQSREHERAQGGRAARPIRFRHRLKAALPWLFQQYLAWRTFPDQWGQFAPTLVSHGKSLHPSLVYSSGPPMSVHRAARLIAAHHGVPWIAEFRDPWTDAATGRPAFSGTIMTWAASRLRRQIVHEPTATVAVSDGIAKWLTSEGAQEVVLSRNGIPDRLLEDSGPRMVSAGTIAYFGAFYLERSPAPFFAALGALQRGSALSSDFSLTFVGEVQEFGGRSVSELLDEHGLLENAQLRSRMPHDQVTELMRSSGVLLLLAQRQPNQVPNKLYEYLAARRPILAWVDHAGESAAILRRIGGHFLVTEHTPAAEIPSIVAAALRAAREGWISSNSSELDALRSSRQLAKVVDLVSQVQGHS